MWINFNMLRSSSRVNCVIRMNFSLNTFDKGTKAQAVQKNVNKFGTA